MRNPQLTAARTQDPNQFTLNGGNLRVKLSLGGPDGLPPEVPGLAPGQRLQW